MQQQVLESIIDIKLKSTNESIPMKTKRFEFEISKYSAKKNSIWHVYINDSRIGRKSDIIITYKCSECENINQVNSTQFLRKFRSGTNRCTHCALDYHNSKPGHNKPNNKIKPVKLSFIEFHENSIRDFQSYPDEYRYAYILSHLSEEDFERLKPKIVSICNGKYTNIDNFDYWSIYKVNNQMAFSSVLYDKVNKTILKANQPILKCDICDKIWRAKSLEGFKNAYKVLCNDSKLCNSTFKLRPAVNINNDKIMYQSKLEKKFIDWCGNNNILVKNGPIVNYNFDGKNRIYKVDFEIKDLLIEIKDFHIWHKNQVESGKWKAKEDSAREYVKNNNYIDFFMITPQNWDEYTNKITQLNKI